MNGAFDCRALAGYLPADYSVEMLRRHRFSGRLRETFDGHLLRGGRVLLQMDRKALLVDLKTGRMDEQEVPGDWRFSDELKGGAVGRACADASRLRAFMPVSALAGEAHDWAIRNGLKKTVVRIRSVQLVHAAKQAVWIFIEPLRGYAADAQRVRRALECCGCGAFGCDYAAALGLRIPAVEPGPAVQIDPAEPVFENACRIAAALLAAARRNEAGICNDIDTEFLHDYRVSLRRIRSLLSLLKGVYAEAFSASVRIELAAVMKATCRLRDLDVYLLERASFYALVPENLYAGLDSMFSTFAAEREDALRQVRAVLDAPAYEQAMKQLAAAFQPPAPQNRGPAAARPMRPFAERLILKRYRKAAAIASGLGADAPEAEVHALRIQCKKLRYLMEFFQPLFPDEQLKPLLKTLKRLQDVLGRFNDYCVQRESLASFITSRSMTGQRGPQASASAGALAAMLYQLQQQVRQEVELNLELFVNKKTANAFRALFEG